MGALLAETTWSGPRSSLRSSQGSSNRPPGPGGLRARRGQPVCPAVEVVLAVRGRLEWRVCAVAAPRGDAARDSLPGQAGPGLSRVLCSESLKLWSSRGLSRIGGPREVGPAGESGLKGSRLALKGGCGVGPRLSAVQTLTSLSQELMEEPWLPPGACEVYASNSSLMLLMMLTGLEPEARACREQALPRLARLAGRPGPASPPRDSSSTTVNTSSSSPLSSNGCCSVTVVVSRPRSRRPRVDEWR